MAENNKLPLNVIFLCKKAKLSLNRDLSLNKVSLNRDCTVLNMYVAVGIARYNMQKD